MNAPPTVDHLPIDHLLPLAVSLPTLECETCETPLTPVPPANLIYRCPTCHPKTLVRRAAP